MIAPAHRDTNTVAYPPIRREGPPETDRHARPLPAQSLPEVVSQRASETVGKHPLVAVVAATAVGFATGWLIKRSL